MQTTRKRTRVPILIAIGACLALCVGGVAFIRAGIYDVGADDPHLPATYAMLEQLRNASIQARAGKLEVSKDLMSTARITQGAGNYDAMCTQCISRPDCIERTEPRPVPGTTEPDARRG